MKLVALLATLAATSVAVTAVSANESGDGTGGLVTQRAMLYEEPTGSSSGVTAINAAVTWRYVENGANGPTIEANLQVPERHLKVKVTIHKNADKSLPASHLIEIQIDASPDFPGKGIKQVPRIVMKPTDEARGAPLVGADAKITDGFFWIALSATEADISANLALLRERDWIDLPFVYETGQRAILTFEKGSAGDQIFQKAMAAWTTGSPPLEKQPFTEAKNTEGSYSADWPACHNVADPDLSIPACSKIIAAGGESNEKLAVVYNNRGAAYDGKGDYDREIVDETRAIELNAQLAAAYKDRGGAYWHKGDYDRAIVDLNKAVELEPGFPDAYVSRGIAFDSKGDNDDAMTDYNKAIAIKPDYALAYARRGLAYTTKGDNDNAIVDYDKAIGLSPDYAESYVGRGIAYERKGDHERAVSDFNEAKRLKPLLAPAVDQIRRQLAEETPATLPQKSVEPPSGLAQVAGEPGHRVALAIGNGAYLWPMMPQLKNPPHDAVAIGNTLKSLGFDVDIVTDATKQAMEDAIARLARNARDADIVIVFYAGHGLQDQGRNYLAPVDAALADEIDLRHRFIRLDDVLDDLSTARGARILLLDACRDNGAVDALRAALPSSRSASISRGLAMIAKTEGQLVAFATQPDRVAADGESVDSPFTTALVAHLGEPGIELRTVLTRVRVDVARATNNQQIPEVSDSLLGEVYLRPLVSITAPAPTK